ncbi:Guanine nucleotide-binding protein G(t) subunit alpha-3 like [Actinidia chinensis var. chinensis]|uniref:Guanine nucleotide-binding protein G(T) subunit alpha-3 like n=1 Tax=Actinidia chinensis var. chinensis TaxID=1590841 RepID=A0A2R6QVG2_ACTCC|nr:Guanine nucleotide-binding protein G(t) subunit alpha-3 like [Actinidia chinensis var. chinensis]
MMPHKFRPVTALLLFTGLNAILVSTITPVYDSVCFHPYWERRRERHRLEREAALARESESTQMSLQVKT